MWVRLTQSAEDLLEQKGGERANSPPPAEHFLLALDFGAPQFSGVGLWLIYSTSFPGSLACRWQIAGLLSLPEPSLVINPADEGIM